MSLGIDFEMLENTDWFLGVIVSPNRPDYCSSHTVYGFVHVELIVDQYPQLVQPLPEIVGRCLLSFVHAHRNCVGIGDHL